MDELSPSFQVGAKSHRAGRFEGFCLWAPLNVYITTHCKFSVQ